jgi:hypothetical protein
MGLKRFMGRMRAWVAGSNWLFLDDVRNPPAHLSKVFDTVRDFDQFKEWVETYGIPELVSFDHDLHIEHVEYFFNRGGFRNPPDPREGYFVNPTGYECADWLIRRCIELDRYPRFVIVHSANPVGSEQIYNMFSAFTGDFKTEVKCRKIRWGIKPRR